MKEKIEIFEVMVHKLKDWYMEQKKISGLEEFNRVNDFSILKIIKLHFLVTAINSENDDLLLNKFTFFAMPYGPVESDIYGKIKGDKDFASFSITNFNSNFSQNNPVANISGDINNAIRNSIEIIKKIEPTLICSDAGTLVELTHKWNCWKKTYKEATSLGIYSKEIPKESILKDNKILNLDLVW